MTKTASFYFTNLEFAATTRVNCQSEVPPRPCIFLCPLTEEALFGVSVAAEKEAEQPGQGLRLGPSTCNPPLVSRLPSPLHPPPQSLPLPRPHPIQSILSCAQLRLGSVSDSIKSF
ncbi:hypothetical protein HZ326_5272 [Fusarium oxysporum f. sp. albedinis]|nr:hypothetical protein HZ326_5272 [Fusarium oxysporum f. sp. albedinis]